MTRSLSLTERAEKRAREARAVEAGDGRGGGRGLDQVLREVQEDLDSPMPPLRARGVSTLTKVRRRW
jgi:hypothetical protein